MKQCERFGGERSVNIRSLLLSLTNAALYLVTCVLIGTGLLLEFRMDEEDGAARLFGMGQDDWGEIHFAFAIGVVILSLCHLLLNWTWVKRALVKAKPAYVVMTAGLGLIAVLLLWPAEHSWLREFFD
jgi:formate-dependent nitrite reductase membrane component NrfD